jgi:pimeloyl-ACP methyl ester carboxylesterase
MLICRTTLDHLISKLSPQNTYEFIDGDFTCEAAFGVDLLYSGPYLCYYDRHDTSSIRSALDVLQDIIEEDGPFDGVIGFSQGAALAASLLLYHQLQTPQKPLPFKMAIFIAGGLPLSPSPNIGKDITLEAQMVEKTARILLSSVEENDHRSKLGAVQFSTHEVESEQLPGLDSKIFSFDPEFSVKASIAIPTVHIIGSNDPWAGYSKSLVKLCRTDLAKVHFHNGAHEVPRNQISLRMCAQLIETAIGMAQRGQGAQLL